MRIHRIFKNDLKLYILYFLVFSGLGGCAQKGNTTDKNVTSTPGKIQDEGSGQVPKSAPDLRLVNKKKSDQKIESKKESNPMVTKKEKGNKKNSKGQQSAQAAKSIPSNSSKKIELIEYSDGIKIKQFFESETVDIDSNMSPSKNQPVQLGIVEKPSQKNTPTPFNEKKINQHEKIKDVDAVDSVSSSGNPNLRAAKNLKMSPSKNDLNTEIDLTFSEKKESTNSSSIRELILEPKNIPENKFKENQINKISKKEFSWKERKNSSSFSGRQIELGWKEKESEKRAVIEGKRPATQPPLNEDSRSYDSLSEFIFQDRSVNSVEYKDGLNKGEFEKIKNWNEGRGQDWKGDYQNVDEQRYKKALKWIQQKGRTYSPNSEQD